MDAMASAQPIDRDVLLAKYADVADELAECLSNLDFVQNVAPQLADDADGGSANRSAGYLLNGQASATSASSARSAAAAWASSTKPSSSRSAAASR